ncbi:hypothetical protein CPC735_031410 [Coccidioides posadasii C735 delta SOWgp]|uniref:Rhodopsin domain-containing protein n=4 Tax=Coccidioides posadasii TaxID=199306 RepID=E9DBQ7_COCPS|nr:hypothetical protein CPC735_031410 [Coccidioides posadasii C735 delta SOWgp]EER27805.1 hypothetical protein CPC735_031410 [Coccidioides posadasii C735 delta SOWgp]EFW16209.1 conserved hypothetical protein [Coccidioides posadasii str. Silveira]KMM67731.1 hypothetical protein CPAG_04064 [Coccidioides posadasii RMSCC 3488]|eukprot:XP_003069950.1 hypothetical protein CPC735_031410 [Coccidioides posadasii C735 delta SOWgp]
MRHPPPEVIASWPTPNYVNPEFQGPQLAVVGITLLVISFIVVFLRMYVRIWIRRSAGWDDWLMLLVLPILLSTSVISIIATRYGWGIHIWDNKKEWFRPSRISSWSSEVLYVLLITLLKISILLSYLRFLTTRTSRFITWAMVGVMVAWFIAYEVIMLLNCIPLQDYWDNPTPDAKCIDEFGKLFSSAITNFVTDFVVLLLPIPTLWTLRLPIRDKIVLVALMSLGFTACAAAAIKVYYSYKAVLLTYDVTWEGYGVWLWSDVEINLAVISPSVPILRPLAQRYFPRLGFRSMPQSSDRTPNRSSFKAPRAIYRQDTIQQIIDDSPDHTSSTEAFQMSPSPISVIQPKQGRRPSNDWSEC